MESSHVSMLRYFINLSFFLYFMILLAERAQSIVRCFLDKSLKTDALDIYMYVLVILSLVGAFVFLTVNQRAMFSGLFTRNGSHGVYDSRNPVCIIRCTGARHDTADSGQDRSGSEYFCTVDNACIYCGVLNGDTCCVPLGDKASYTVSYY